MEMTSKGVRVGMGTGEHTFAVVVGDFENTNERSETHDSVSDSKDMLVALREGVDSRRDRRGQEILSKCATERTREESRSANKDHDNIMNIQKSRHYSKGNHHFDEMRQKRRKEGTVPHGGLVREGEEVLAAFDVPQLDAVVSGSGDKASGLLC